jgi:DNA replication and repair protein RecF
MALVELTSLSLTNYRSYRTVDLRLEQGLIVVHGDNAQGKSNLLEAAYLLAIGKSYRASTERELVSWEAAEAGSYAMVVGTVLRADGQAELRIGLDCAGTPPNGVQKRIRINGLPKRASELIGVLNAVLFSAEDIDLIFGPPSGRRRYLDILVSQLGASLRGGRYVQALQRYQRVVTQRNHVLRALREGRAGEDELAYWDGLLCTEGASVLGARFDAIERLSPLSGDAFGRLEGGANAMSLEYVSTTPSDGRPTAESIAVALERSRSQERAMAMTVVGPHRDDLRVALGDIEMSKHASRGQARLAALSLRIAEAQLLRERTGESPILLLDDVLSELDESRRALVVEEASRYQQAIVSTADLSLLPRGGEEGTRRLRVQAGQVLEEATA